MTQQKKSKEPYRRNIHIKRASVRKIAILAERLGYDQKCDVIDHALSLAITATNDIIYHDCPKCQSS